jgi:Fic family protein
MVKGLKLISSAYLKQYSRLVEIDWMKAYKSLQLKNDFTADDFSFYLISSSVESSRIEGNTLTLDDYLRNTQFNIQSKPKDMAEINDLLSAYRFAVDNKLTKKNFLHAHKLSGTTILELPAHRGKLRQSQVGIYGGGRLVYMAMDYKLLKAAFDKLFDDISLLIQSDLSPAEVFYYAAMIHLLFEKIHPFADGNGRTGRLLEKWFLAEKIGTAAWSIASEKYYMDHRAEYYKALDIGMDYETIDWNKCLPFLELLPKAIKL